MESLVFKLDCGEVELEKAEGADLSYDSETLEWLCTIRPEDWDAFPNQDALASVQLTITDTEGNVYVPLSDAVLQVRASL